MSALSGTGHWKDPSWRRALEDQLADELERLRLLLGRRAAWLRHRDGRAPLAGAVPGVVTGDEASSALGSPDLAAEEEFYRADREAARMGRAAQALAGQARERSGAMAAAGTPFPLDRIVRTFALDELAAEVLRLALAPELDVGFERIFAWVHDDATRRWPTPALAAALFGGTGTGAGRVRTPPALDPSGPLFRWALLRPADGSVSLAVRPLRLERRIAWYLQAVDHDDVGDEPRLRDLPATPPSPEVVAVAGPAARSLRSAGRAGDGDGRPLVNAVGGTAGEAAALASAVAGTLGMGACWIAPARGERGVHSVARLDREAALRDSLVLVHAADGDEGEERGDAAVELAGALAAPVVLWSPHPVRIERPVVSVRTPRTGHESARSIWRRAVGAAAPSEEILDRIVHHFDLDPDQILRVAAAARGAARLRGEEAGDADLWSACRVHGRRRLGALAQRIEPGFGWDDIVLAPDVRRQLQEIVDQVRHRALVYERWRFGDQLARGSGVTALFSGPSGTGKTMAAEVLAGELELDLYRIDLAGVVSKYIGETEKNLRRIFEAAEEGGAVLFFDEADALFGKRTDIRDSHDRYANIEVDYLLQRMESYRGLAILATNRRAALDRAFLRRLRFLVEFPFPAADVRLRIWQRVLPEGAPRDGVDFPALARMELAGGNIRGIAINAAFLAAADGRVITMEHLAHAAAREYAKLDKAPTSGELGDVARGGAT